MAACEISRNYITRVCLFVIDSEADLAVLPTTEERGKEDVSASAPCAMGSIAELVDGSKSYRLNGNDEWIEYVGSTSGGGTDPEEEIEPIDDSAIESLFD